MNSIVSESLNSNGFSWANANEPLLNLRVESEITNKAEHFLLYLPQPCNVGTYIMKESSNIKSNGIGHASGAEFIHYTTLTETMHRTTKIEQIGSFEEIPVYCYGNDDVEGLIRNGIPVSFVITPKTNVDNLHVSGNKMSYQLDKNLTLAETKDNDNDKNSGSVESLELFSMLHQASAMEVNGDTPNQGYNNTEVDMDGSFVDEDNNPENKRTDQAETALSMEEEEEDDDEEIGFNDVSENEEEMKQDDDDDDDDDKEEINASSMVIKNRNISPQFDQDHVSQLLAGSSPSNNPSPTSKTPRTPKSPVQAAKNTMKAMFRSLRFKSKSSSQKDSSSSDPASPSSPNNQSKNSKCNQCGWVGSGHYFIPHHIKKKNKNEDFRSLNKLYHELAVKELASCQDLTLVLKLAALSKMREAGEEVEFNRRREETSKNFLIQGVVPARMGYTEKEFIADKKTILQNVQLCLTAEEFKQLSPEFEEEKNKKIQKEKNLDAKVRESQARFGSMYVRMKSKSSNTSIREKGNNENNKTNDKIDKDMKFEESIGNEKFKNIYANMKKRKEEENRKKEKMNISSQIQMFSFIEKKSNEENNDNDEQDDDDDDDDKEEEGASRGPRFLNGAPTNIGASARKHILQLPPKVLTKSPTSKPSIANIPKHLPPAPPIPNLYKKQTIKTKLLTHHKETMDENMTENGIKDSDESNLTDGISKPEDKEMNLVSPQDSNLMFKCVYKVFSSSSS